jgi:hypothetical protein
MWPRFSAARRRSPSTGMSERCCRNLIFRCPNGRRSPTVSPGWFSVFDANAQRPSKRNKRSFRPPGARASRNSPRSTQAANEDASTPCVSPSSGAGRARTRWFADLAVAAVNQQLRLVLPRDVERSHSTMRMRPYDHMRAGTLDGRAVIVPNSIRVYWNLRLPDVRERPHEHAHACQRLPKRIHRTLDSAPERSER